MSRSIEQCRRLKTSLIKVHKYFKQYCESTSIHGFKYLGEDRSIFEKLWWVVIFILCLSGCSFMIYQIYEKYDTSPVVVTFATKETSIYHIPFPAVTICPETKAKKSEFNLTDVYLKRKNLQNLTQEEIKNIEYASLVCDHDKWDLHNSTRRNETYGEELFAALDKVKVNISDFIVYCKIDNDDTEYKLCTDLFTPVFTDEGILFKKDHQVWSLEKGYGTNIKVEVYPFRALFSGASSGLILHLAAKVQDIDIICKDVQGFKVVLHPPMTIPRLKHEFFRVPLDHAVVAAVEPFVHKTSEAVKHFGIEKRNCYFSSDKQLKYFRTYSQRNCLLECLTNITLDECGCVNIFMPRDNNTRICGLDYYECMREAEDWLQLQELYSYFRVSKKKVVIYKELEEYCDCLPLCTQLKYDVDISQSPWNRRESKRLLGFEEKFEEETVHLSSLTVYFKYNHFISSERHVLYGPTDFVANFGGLLGLFTGFSILSLMEIIYFLTVRICCNVRLFRRWTGVD